MKNLFWLACLYLLASCSNQSFTIYVDGGQLSQPEELRFSSLEEAWIQAKKLKLEHSAASVVIQFASGNYYLTEPLVIDPELNGLSLIGKGASSVSIRGSVPLNLTWNKYSDSIFVAEIQDRIHFDQLVVNNSLQILARYPNYNEHGGHWQGHAEDAISKDRIATWSKPVGALVHAMHCGEWGGFHYRITEIDAQGNAIFGGGHQNNRPSPPHPKYRMVENIQEELDSPGEWFLDEATHQLYYWPANGIDLGTAVFEGVVLKNLISINGTKENPVKNITIKGIKFEYAQRTIMEAYEPLLRSDWTIFRGGAVFIEGAENCSIADCEFTNLGGNAVFVSGYTRNIEVSGNHIHEVGASGICFVGDPSAVRSPSFQYDEFVPLNEIDTVPGPKNELYPQNCMADNNLIHRIGRIEKQTAGVQISMAMNIKVSNNSIYDVPRAGINIGDGTWGGHVLEYNDVFNTVLESGDHGSFNSWGRDRFWHPNREIMDSITMANRKMVLWDAMHTTIIRNNRFRCDHGWDIDLDDGSSNYHIYNNLCLNGGLKLREGFFRVAENNVLVNNGFHPHVWFANCEDVFRKNILSTGHKDIRLSGWGKEVDKNLFPDEASLLNAQQNGVDASSSFGNPLFEDPDKGDFRVKENSPALKLGFVNFPMDQFGVKKPELKALAAQPVIPALIFHSGDNSHLTVEWLGAKLKNITTMEERSASGLSETSGVLIVDAAKQSLAVKNGLQVGDVISAADGKKVETTTDLLKIYQENNWKGHLTIAVHRNQKTQNIEISTK